MENKTEVKTQTVDKAEVRKALIAHARSKADNKKIAKIPVSIVGEMAEAEGFNTASEAIKYGSTLPEEIALKAVCDTLGEKRAVQIAEEHF